MKKCQSLRCFGCLQMLLACLVLQVIFFSVFAQAKSWEETDALAKENIESFQDLKFGLFVHWGIYSQWGCVESWPIVESKKQFRPDNLQAWVERDKDFNRFCRDYANLNTTFNPKHFNPQSWVDMANAAGMKYFVFTTKHHDGFCMFDTKQTDYRSTHSSCPFHTNPRANITKVLFDAFRENGFVIGAYFSKPDWHNPDYWIPGQLHKLPRVNYDTTKQPRRWGRFVDFLHAQVEELVTGYGPIDILWLDGSMVRLKLNMDVDREKLLQTARKHQPGIIFVDRTSYDRYENYLTPEQCVPKEPLDSVWETCMTMGEQWSYRPDDNYKSTRQLIHLLVDVVAKGGNLLLNVGPDANGVFNERAIDRLKNIGDWLKNNGEAIYGTRPIVPYKQNRVCMTQKEDYIYLIYLAEWWQTIPPKKVVVSDITLHENSKINMLGVDTPLEWSIKDGVVVIEVPEWLRTNPPCNHAWAFKIQRQ